VGALVEEGCGVIVRHERAMIISGNANTMYWEPEVFPPWTALNCFRLFAGHLPGYGVEPHYHDGDELWVFTIGRGEVWLDGQVRPLTPNTAVYTPMGTVHRFQMFTEAEIVAVVTRLERQRRATHILVEEEGPPEPTVAGFVVPGAENDGPFPARGPRCPLSEFRAVTLAAGEALPAETLPRNEHWLVLEGDAHLTLDDLTIDLTIEDVALLRAGAVRRLHSVGSARLALARE
jgi:mannose-6-phosphate isomerase-like protein (cupin superfamily)